MALPPFGISEAQIVGLWLETLFWGFFLITFFMCLRTLLFNAEDELKRKEHINWPMLIVALLLFVFATLDVILGFVHNLQAFIFYTGPGGSDAEFTNISDIINIMKTVDVEIQTIIGDGMLIYRCWVVYSKDWKVVAFSFILWIGTIVTTIYDIYIESSLHAKVLIGAKQLQPVIDSFWACTILLNVLTTFLIVYRIYKADKNRHELGFSTASTAGRTFTSTGSSKKRPSRLRRVMRIVIESGLMYTTIALITFITYIVNSNSVYPTSDVEVQVVGIAFNLIIIRSDSSKRNVMGSTVGGSTSVPLGPFNRGANASVTRASDAENLKVVVAHEVDYDTGKSYFEGSRHDVNDSV